MHADLKIFSAALIVVWSLALSLTASCLSLSTVRFRIPTGSCEYVTSALGIGGGFCWVLRFSPVASVDDLNHQHSEFLQMISSVSFENNLRIKQKLTKNLNEDGCLAAHQHFS